MTTKINTVPGARKPPPPAEHPHLELPFGWEPGPDSPEQDGRGARFRFPAPDDPRPGSRRLLGMALCACLLGLAGLAVSVRALLSVVSAQTPGWYAPAVAGLALTGMLPVIGAFLSVHRPRLPWLLLLVAAPPLVAAAAVTATH